MVNSMQHFTYTIKDAIGLHARPARLLCKEAAKFKSTVTLCAGEKRVQVGRLMAMMSMGLRTGTAVTVEIEGADEDACAASMRQFFEQNL